MSKQQLYINDVAVDMPSDTIKIKVESNLFSDADKVMTAHSYNIVLPRTMTNDSVFALAYVAGADTGGISTHKYLTASLYMDGVPLFVGGQAVLTKVDEKGYNLSLIWGIIGIFDEIKREGLKLNELPLSDYWSEQQGDWLYLARNVHEGLSSNPYNSGMNTTVYDTLDADSVTQANTYPWWMPVNSAQNLLGVISRIYGVTFDISQRAQQRIAELMHIATTLNIVAKGENVVFTVLSRLDQATSNKYVINWGQPANPQPCQHAFDETLRYATSGVTRNWVARRNLHIKAVTVYGERDHNDFQLVFTKGTPSQINPTYNPSTGYYEVNQSWYNIQLDAGDVLPAISVVPDGVPLGSHTQFTMVVAIDEVEEGTAGMYWSYTRNAPDIKVIDYLSEILAHIGGVIVGSVTHTDKVRIMTFDEIAESSAIAYDMQGLKQINMSMSDLAQKNKYIHKDNDDDENQGLPTYTAEGVIYTNDATLKDERDAFKSDFKVPRTNKMLHWKVEKNENASTYKASWQNAGNNVEGFDLATFTYLNTGQDFATTIANYYTNYEAIVNRPKTIELIVRLSVLELLDFDFSHPIFIPQLGRTYLVKTLETDSNDTYKLTLVQI